MKIKIFFLTVLVAVTSSLATLFIYEKYASPALSPLGASGIASPYQFTSASFPVAPSGMAPVDFTYAAALTTPSVVHVKTKYEHTASNQGSNDIFRQFFGGNDFFWDQPNTPSEASGSGVIVDPKGYIVTNYHVVKDADEIKVVFFDKHETTAKLVATDPSTDVALLKVDVNNDLPYIRMGNSDSVRVGDWVMAVGNPFDLTSTVTAGIVSAKGRKIDILGENASTPIESFIQTDAAVNPGNSGGALVNLKGELIGINTAIATPTGAFAGYSFAVPVNIVKKVVGDLEQYGVVQRAYLGVEVDISKEDLGGVYVSNVMDGSGAADAGIKVGDVITNINSAPVHSFPELQEQLSEYGPGDKINVGLIRNNERMNVIVLLKNKLGTTDLVTKEMNSEIMSLGIETQDLTKKQAESYDIDGGVEVTGIHDGIIAHQTSIQEGFIITSVDGKAVKEYNDLATAVKDKKGDNIIIEGFYPQMPNRIYSYGLNL